MLGSAFCFVGGVCLFVILINISTSSDNNVNSSESHTFYFRYLMHKDLKPG